jgi:hypothetical protein
MKIEEQLAKAKKGTPERVVGEYLLERMKADEDMARRYEESDRTLSGCMAYITEKARKKAVHSQCCMTSEEVFDLAVHYALDGSENDTNKTTNENAEVAMSEDEEYTPKKKSAVKPKKEKPKPLGEQLSLF